MEAVMGSVAKHDAKISGDLMQLVLFLALGVGLFVLFAALAIKRRPAQSVDAEAMSSFIRAVDLEAVPFEDVDALVGRRDYAMLLSRPEHAAIARQFRRDRRRIVLAWLKALQGDARAVWRIHRLLISRGAPATVQEEIQIAIHAAAAISFLSILRSVVYVLGPFAIFSLLSRSRRQVGKAYLLCAVLWNRLPPSVSALRDMK
jgi:hypothetical protein